MGHSNIILWMAVAAYVDLHYIFMVSFIASMTFTKNSHFHGRSMFNNKDNNSCHLTIKIFRVVNIWNHEFSLEMLSSILIGICSKFSETSYLRLYKNYLLNKMYSKLKDTFFLINEWDIFSFFFMYENLVLSVSLIIHYFALAGM